MIPNRAMLVPELLELFERHLLVCISAGLDVRMVSGYRDAGEQLALFAKGRECTNGVWKVIDPSEVVTKALPEHDPHCRGAAYDICLFVNGKAAWDRIDLFKVAGGLGKALGLAWGGDWPHLHDYGHFELPTWTELPLHVDPLAR